MLFDLETTSLSGNARILELAMRDFSGGEFSAMQTLVNPGPDCEKVHREAYKAHGIRLGAVQKATVPT